MIEQICQIVSIELTSAESPSTITRPTNSSDDVREVENTGKREEDRHTNDGKIISKDVPFVVAGNVSVVLCGFSISSVECFCNTCTCIPTQYTVTVLGRT